jgi:hypothetical protein
MAGEVANLMDSLGDALDLLFKAFYFLLFVAPFICLGLGILIGWWIWG